MGWLSLKQDSLYVLGFGRRASDRKVLNVIVNYPSELSTLPQGGMGVVGKKKLKQATNEKTCLRPAAKRGRRVNFRLSIRRVLAKGKLVAPSQGKKTKKIAKRDSPGNGRERLGLAQRCSCRGGKPRVRGRDMESSQKAPPAPPCKGGQQEEKKKK